MHRSLMDNLLRAASFQKFDSAASGGAVWIIRQGAAEFGKSLGGLAVDREECCPIGAGLGIIGGLLQNLCELTLGLGIVSLLREHRRVIIANLRVGRPDLQGGSVCCCGLF